MRITGVEPARLLTLEPKSSASANSAISANKRNYNRQEVGLSNLFVQNGKDSVILITNDVGNKKRKDDESMGALVALGVFTAIAIVAVIVVVAAVAAIVAGVTDSTKEEEV